MDRLPRLKRYPNPLNVRRLMNVKWSRTLLRSRRAPRLRLSSILWPIGSNRTLIWTEWTIQVPRTMTHTLSSLNMSSKGQLTPVSVLYPSGTPFFNEILASLHSRIRLASTIPLHNNMHQDIMKWAETSHRQEANIWTRPAISVSAAICKLQVLPS